MSDNEVKYSKKNQREVSSFIGQELLYDYIAHKLDADRASAVEEFVRTSREAQSDVHKINSALGFLDHLSETTVSESLVQEIQQPSSYLDLLLKRSRIDEWPPVMKMGVELLVVSIGVLSLILVVPWHKVIDINFSRSKEFVLLEIEKNKNQANSEIPATEEKDVETSYPDEGIKPSEIKASNSPAPAKAGSKSEIASEAKLVVAKQSEEVVKVSSIRSEKATTKTEGKSEKQQGFLYRGEIKVTNLSVTTEKFVDYITEIGGRKAGGVPIGWTKGSSTYFHFTMPDAKFSQLQEYLKSYGELNIQKENHDRIMPEGIVRIIITVYEK